MLAQSERAAGIDRDNFIDPIAENEATIQDRHTGFFQWKKLTVEIDDIAQTRLAKVLHKPQSDGVPQPAKEAGNRYTLAGYQFLRIDDLAIQCEFSGADFLPGIDRRNQRLLTGQCGFHSAVFTFGQGDVQIFSHGSCQQVVLALPYLELIDGGASLVDQMGFVELEAVIQQFLTFCCTGVFRSGTEYDGDEAGVFTLG